MYDSLLAVHTCKLMPGPNSELVEVLKGKRLEFERNISAQQELHNAKKGVWPSSHG